MLKTCDRTPKLENFQEDVIMLYSGYLKPVKIQQISFRMILISTIYPFVQHLRLTCECFHLDTTRHKSKPFAEKRKCFPPCNARKRLGDLLSLNALAFILFFHMSTCTCCPWTKNVYSSSTESRSENVFYCYEILSVTNMQQNMYNLVNYIFFNIIL